MGGSKKAEQDGDPPPNARDAAFTEFYTAEAPWLVRYFRRNAVPAEDAHDLAQEAMVRLLRVGPSADIESPQGYLRRIATNLLRDRASAGSTRLGKASVPFDEAFDKATDFDPHREVEARLEVEYWTKALDELKPITLEIFLLSRVEGYTYNEITKRLNVPLWIVQRNMLKAIKHIAAKRKNRDA